MIGAARATMNQRPLLLLCPCIALTVTILIMNSFCDGLSDMFDPSPVPARWIVGAASRTASNDAAQGSADAPLLAITDLTLSVSAGGGGFAPVRNLDLALRAGETLAIVGESGSGKSLTGLSIMGLLPPAVAMTGGAIRLAGRDIAGLGEEALESMRGKVASMIFQDPMSSLNPVMRVGDQIGEAILAHQALSAGQASGKAAELIAGVGIPDSQARTRAYPHELSGGMRQRIMIAMAIVNDPILLIADEPTTALDVTIQARVLDLLADLKKSRGLAMIFISHSLPVVADIADRVIVMYAGEMVEEGPAKEVFARPRHPYTAALIACAPNESGAPPRPIDGVVPSPTDLPTGCVFAPRCGMRIAACEAARPTLIEIALDRRSRCLRWSEL